MYNRAKTETSCFLCNVIMPYRAYLELDNTIAYFCSVTHLKSYVTLLADDLITNKDTGVN